MTVSTTYSQLTYAGNGSVTSFAVSWQFLEAASLVVTLIAADETETVQTLGTHYTVAGGTNASGLPATGTVSMLTAPASGETLRIERNTPATQSSQWSVAGVFNETSIEAALDRNMLIAQENGAALDSATEAAASATAAAASATSAAASEASAETYYDLIIANYVQPSSTETYEHLVLDDISSGFDGTTTGFDLEFSSTAFTPASAASLIVQVNGVMQRPTTDYTISSSTITFTTAPASGDTCNIRALKTSMSAADIAIVDAGGLIVATTVEAALAENRTAIDNLEAIYAAGGLYAAPTRTALKALDTSVENEVYLTEAGREGLFLFLSGDYSTEVTADAGEGVYIAADDTASTSGAWVRVYEGNPNVTWWGTAGDGTTDDATAINRALIGATGKTLHVPPATYKVGSALSVPADTFIRAYGSTLNASTAGNITVLTFANGGGVEGARFVGPGNSSYNASSIAIACAGTNNSPSAPTYVDGPVIRHCHIEEFAGYGTRFQYCNQPIVEHCRFDDIGYAACGGLSCNDGVFEHNVVDDVSPGSGGGDAYGAFFDRNEAGDETADPRSYRCSMSYNTILNSAGEALDSHAGVDIKIVGNTVRSCLKGIVLTRSNISSAPALAPQNCVVANNTIVIEDDGPAIVVSGAFDSGWVEYAIGCVVSDNTVYGGGDAADNEGGSVLVQGTKKLTITGNTITAPTVWGINVYFGNSGINVSGNTIADPWDNTVTIPACICIRGNDNSGYIGGNTFRYENSGFGTYVAINSIYIYGSLTGLSLDIGRCAFDGIASGRLSYSANTTTGVNDSGLMVQSGTASISLTDTSSVSHAVTFGGRFPSVPRVMLTRSGSPVPGTVAKAAILESNSIAVTGLNIIARPYDITTFGGAGTLVVHWVATT